jgi:hypothetical protein
MTLQAVALMMPLAADGVTQVQHPAELFRALSAAVSRRPGVCKPGPSQGATNTGDFALTVVPGAMQATLAAGKCFIVGQENTLQSAGNYFGYSEAIETISWPAASGSNRMDTLLLQVADPQYGSIGGNPLGASWRAVAGSSASARPDTDFKSGGSQYVPGAWIRMYDVLVPASATQLTQANVAFKAGYANVNGVTPFFSASRPASGIFYGECGWELDTGTEYIWNGTIWAPNLPTILTQEHVSDTPRALTIAPADDPAWVFNNLPASAVYQVNSKWIYSADAAGDLRIGWTCNGVGATFDWSVNAMGNTAASSVDGDYHGVNTLSGTDAAGGLGVGTKLRAEPSGVLKTGTGAAITFRPQWAQWASSSNGTTVYGASRITLTRIG